MFNRREVIVTLTAGLLGMRGRLYSAADVSYPIRKAKIELLWKSPDGHPNALEATDQGLWLGEQVTDTAYLLDWKTGKVLRKVPTESSNTSGMAYGGGFLWMAANGKGIMREARPTDATTGTIVQVDPATRKTVARHPVPGGGGVHGLTWGDDSLWITTLKQQTLTQVDKNFKILHSIPVPLTRAHGLAWDNGTIWCMFSNDYRILRLDAKDGRVLEAIQLDKAADPDPHGMTRYQGKLYYCDAGIAPGAVASNSKYAGYVCRLHL